MSFTGTSRRHGGCGCRECGARPALSGYASGERLYPAGATRRPLGEVAAECGSRYLHLVNNGVGGTLKSPCRGESGVQIYCSDTDVNAWLASADHMFALVRTAWNAVAVANPAAAAALRPSVTRYEEEFCEADDKGVCTKILLPGGSWNPITGFAWNAQAAIKIAAHVANGACQLEQLNDALQSAGVKPENVPIQPAGGGGGSIPDAAGGILGGLGSWALGAAAIAGVVMLLRSERRRESRDA